MTRDKFLVELLGECWHEPLLPERILAVHTCRKCGIQHNWLHRNNWHDDFSSWTGFGKLWEAAQKDVEGFTSFLVIQYGWSSPGAIYVGLIHPDRFATAWAKFKGWKDES